MLQEMFPQGAVLNPYVIYAVIQINRGESKAAQSLCLTPKSN